MARANETKLLLSSFLVELDAMESNVRSFLVNNSTAYGKYPASISCKISTTKVLRHSFET